MKRPSFQFYPLEYLSDLELHSCTPAARGIWADMLCLAHHPDRYGHLTINGKPMTDTQIINRIQGATRKLLSELEDANVFSRAADGAIYSRRMVRDEATRNARAEGGELGAEHGPKGAEHGAKGGRPSKQTGDKEPPIKPPLTGESEPPIKPPPSSASAVASASATSKTAKVGVTPTDTARANGSHPAIENTGNSTAKTVSELWWKTPKGVAATAQTLGIERAQNEDDKAFKDRVYSAVEERNRQAQVEAARRGTMRGTSQRER